MSDPSMLSSQVSTDAHEVAGIPPKDDKPTPKKERVGGLWSDAWYDLKRKPLFWVSSCFILFFVTMAVFPQLFTSKDPHYGDIKCCAYVRPNSHAWFGYDGLGQDIYARAIYGARPTLLVGFASVIGVVLIGGTFGMLAGYFGGWMDAVLSRIGDIFFGLPFILGAIVVLSTFRNPLHPGGSVKIISLVVLAIVGLSWPQFARIMRSSVISTKQADYVQAAKALGASHSRIIFRHLLPNAIAPLIVMATIALGVYIGAEATLSYLGIGLQAPVVSWGVMINEAQEDISRGIYILLFPAAFLTAAVLSFVMLGDAIREALDPKLH